MTKSRVDIYLTPADAARALRADVRLGLTAQPKWLPPKWFYDARGSSLFEEITRLREYYPTRAEREILDVRAPEIAAHSGARTLVELGSGSSEKTRLLLDALQGSGPLRQLVLLDVSESALADAVVEISNEYPELTLRGVVGDFTEHLGLVSGQRPFLVAFLGSTIGNLLPDERAKFLASVSDILEPGECLLLGIDLVKDPATLVAAYDDAQGVTGEFNRNVLQVLNRELGADFDVSAFRHRAVWDAEHEWIEMRLVAERQLRVHLPEIQLTVEFAAGEEIRTEISAKFRREGVEGELDRAGFALDSWWTDEEDRFAVALARVG